MTKVERTLFGRLIKDSKYYLEFGLGGSTIYALKHSRAVIYSVESSLQWIEKMRKYRIIKHFEKNRLFIHYVDIGPVGDLGYPMGNDFSLYEKYTSEIFEKINIGLIDLVLVDGRFRVACILKLLLEGYKVNMGLRCMIHDFWNREDYKTVLEFVDPICSKENLVVFKIKEDLDLKAVQKCYELYKYNPK